MISICIPTWNNAEMLLGCLGSIFSYVEAPYHIHILNNGEHTESDGKLFEEFLAERIPEGVVTTHNMDGNKGWMGALNWAWYHGCMDAEYVLALNDDVVFLPYHRDTLSHLSRYILKFPDVGAVGPSTNIVMGSQNIGLHHLPITFATTLLIGFCCMYRKQALDDIADPFPWDEMLPGGDDLDVSIRLRDKGYHLLVDRSIYVHHHGMQTGHRVHGDYWNSTKQQLETNNALIRKHGVKRWYETLLSKIYSFIPEQDADTEGDWIRAKLNGGHGMDLGCGSNKTISTAIGVDRTIKGASGTSGGQRGETAVTDIEADITAIPVDNASQDYLIVRHVFEHIIDSLGALQEWWRILRPHGDLIISCPDQRIVDTIHLDSEHVHAFTPDSLGALMETQGFMVVEKHDVRPGLSFCIHAKKQSDLRGL